MHLEKFLALIIYATNVGNMLLSLTVGSSPSPVHMWKPNIQCIVKT